LHKAEVRELTIRQLSKCSGLCNGSFLDHVTDRSWPTARIEHRARKRSHDVAGRPL